MKKRHLKKLYKKLESLVDRILAFEGVWNVLEGGEMWGLHWVDHNLAGEYRTYMIQGPKKRRGKMLKAAIQNAESGYAGVIYSGDE